MIAAIDCSTLHHEADFLQDADIGERIARNSNDICQIAGFEGADLILPAEEFCAVEEVGLESGERGHAVFNHQVKFAGLGAVGKGTDVGADGHWDPGCELLAKFLGVEVLHAVFALRLSGGGSVVGEIFRNRESWDGEDLFFAHQAHGFVAELVGVINGDDACTDSVESAGFTGSVGRNVFAGTGGFFDGGAEFGFRVLERRREVAVAKRVRACFVDLDEIGAFFYLLADYGDEFGGVVGVGGVGQDVLLGIVADGVFVPAENVDGVAADAQARAGDLAAIDGVANSGVGGACAFGAHVALGGKPSHQIIASGEKRGNGALRYGLFDGLEIFGARMKEEVDVNVNEAWQKSGVA